MNEQPMYVAFIGNPNCGKTTLFNAYTGANLKVANWPGVTVEKKEGPYAFKGQSFRLVDLPGIYSLTSYTMEEKVARQYIMGDEVSVIVDVVDASCLERNLYLALQLIEMGRPVVVALNMMDIVEERGMEIDLHRLPEVLGVPVIPVSARKKTGLDVLMHAVAHHGEAGREPDRLEHHHAKGEGHHHHDHHKDHAVVYSDDIEDKIDLLEERLLEKWPDMVNVRWHAIKILEDDEEVMRQHPIDTSDILERSYETDIINQKYDFIEEVVQECLFNKEAKSERTDRVDRVLTHTVWGIPVFLGIMALVFFFTFTVGDFLKGYFEAGLDILSGAVSGALEAIHVSPVLESLVVDGVIAGVGGILTFLPNIFILFLALAVLEDSGYMARVAYVMDGLMSRLGLSGRAFIPMLLGFGCTVPAIMASRTLENRRDRMKTILITPFMSCSARLPIYVLLSELFFGRYAMLAAYSMYVIGLAVAILVALVVHLIDRQSNSNRLLIELPEYKTPNGHTIAIYVWEKVKEYLTKAGTTIFVASLVLWAVMNFGPGGLVDAEHIGNSFGASIGHAVAPLFAPAGLGYWQIVLSLIAGIAAKEVVVSSMSILFGVSNVNSAAGMSAMAAGLGAMGFTALNAYAMMVFCLLYIPCAATIGIIRKETGSWKWTIFAIMFQLAVAYVMAALVFQIGSLLV